MIAKEENCERAKLREKTEDICISTQMIQAQQGTYIVGGWSIRIILIKVNDFV